jgi:hypothetical protein
MLFSSLAVLPKTVAILGSSLNCRTLGIWRESIRGYKKSKIFQAADAPARRDFAAAPVDPVGLVAQPDELWPGSADQSVPSCSPVVDGRTFMHGGG